MSGDSAYPGKGDDCSLKLAQVLKALHLQTDPRDWPLKMKSVLTKKGRLDRTTKGSVCRLAGNIGAAAGPETGARRWVRSTESGISYVSAVPFLTLRAIQETLTTSHTPTFVS